MIESKLKTGDVVKLKSGGPTMTVSSATDEKIECAWFVDGTVQHSSFTPDTLKSFRGKNVNKLTKQDEKF